MYVTLNEIMHKARHIFSLFSNDQMWEGLVWEVPNHLLMLYMNISIRVGKKIHEMWSPKSQTSREEEEEEAIYEFLKWEAEIRGILRWPSKEWSVCAEDVEAALLLRLETAKWYKTVYDHARNRILNGFVVKAISTVCRSTDGIWLTGQNIMVRGLCLQMEEKPLMPRGCSAWWATLKLYQQ